MPKGSEIAAEVLHDVASRLTPDLRHHAVESGWPSSAAAKLSVTVDEEGSLSYSFRGRQREFQALEFGTYSTPPLPAINNFFGNYRRDKEMRALVAEGVHDRVTKMLAKAFS